MCRHRQGRGTKTKKSKSGNLLLLKKSPIQWTIKRQSCMGGTLISRGRIRIRRNAAQEILRLIKLLEDLNLPQTINLLESNQSCINMAENEKYTSTTKHIEICIHAIKQVKEEGIIDMKYCLPMLTTTDILTKPIPKPEFQKH